MISNPHGVLPPYGNFSVEKSLQGKCLLDLPTWILPMILSILKFLYKETHLIQHLPSPFKYEPSNYFFLYINTYWCLLKQVYHRIYFRKCCFSKTKKKLSYEIQRGYSGVLFVDWLVGWFSPQRFNFYFLTSKYEEKIINVHIPASLW